MDLDNDDQQDTLPGFKMQSENFVLKFITGLQKGVCSKLLEFETDWYDMMEILLSRLEDEPVNQDKFQVIASKDLENWALIQPGGNTLKLKIKVEMEEKLYLRQVLANASVVKSVNPTPKQLGNTKTIKLTFSDRYTTQVVFHAKKKAPKAVGSLRQLAALSASNSLRSIGEATNLAEEGLLPANLVHDLEAAWTNCWT